MTAQWREVASCPRCGTSVSTDVPVKAWIRANENLDSIQQCLCIGDSDLWVQRYGTRRGRRGVDRSVMYLMLVEVKTHGRGLDEPQRDLLHIINQLLRTNPWKEQRANGRFVAGHAQNTRPVYSVKAGKRIQLHCYGVHKLRMSHATPDDSEWITWDDKKIDFKQLVGLLRYDLHPDSLRPMEHRSHKRIIEHPELFDIESLIGGST